MPWLLLLFGTISLLSSAILLSSLIAFIGLGLIFWGVLFLFIRPARYIKSSLLESSMFPALSTINQIITELNFKGKAIYLPASRLGKIKSERIFVPHREEILIPTLEDVTEEKIFLKYPKGICLVPPGVALANLFENSLGTSFTKILLEQLESVLQKALVEDLEIAENLKINTRSDLIRMEITKSIFQDFCKKNGKKSNVCSLLGCPLCSSLACVLVRSIGKPLVIEKIQTSKDGTTIEAYYKIIEE